MARHGTAAADFRRRPKPASTQSSTTTGSGRTLPSHGRGHEMKTPEPRLRGRQFSAEEGLQWIAVASINWVRPAAELVPAVPGRAIARTTVSAGPDSEGGALENHSQPAVPSETAVQVAPSAEAMEPVAAGPSAPRSGSKLARVIELLQRDHGATIDELIDVTDWLAHTTRAALTGLRKRGYAVVIDRSERGSFYRIQADLSAGDRASVARQVEERANSAAARKLAQHSRSRARRAA